MSAAQLPLEAIARERVSMSSWRVGLLLELPGAKPERVELHVWALTSVDAVTRAREEFYGKWATDLDRGRLPLRVLEVLQESV